MKVIFANIIFPISEIIVFEMFNIENCSLDGSNGS